MGFSPLADMRRRVGPAGRQSTRNSPIRGFTIHHQAGVNAHGQATAPGRQVSANYWITNDGVIIPNVDETMRAWTTGSAGYPAGAASDHRNITVEVSNSPEGVRTGSWAISSKARSALEALIADVFERHNLGPVRRGTQSGVAVHRDFVPTECPGGYIMGNLSGIIANAEKLRTNGSTSGGGTSTPTPSTPTPTSQETEMSKYIGMYIGTKKASSPTKERCVIFHPESGFYTTWSGVSQSYHNGMAQQFNTGSFKRITNKHWNQMKAQLDQIRASK